MQGEPFTLGVPSPRAALFWDHVAVAVLASVIALLRVHDRATRIAMVSGDDSLVAVALYFARPQEFAGDVFIQAWSPIAMASMVNWLPALAYKFYSFPPGQSFLIVTVLQFALLAVAMFSLTVAMTGSRAASWITAVFTMAYQPVRWNLAWLGGLDWMPYANWLALPFLIYAFVALLAGRRWFCYVLLLAGGLIHPVMAVLAGMIVVVTHALGRRDDSRWRYKTAEASIGLVVIAVVSVIPAFISMHGFESLPQDSFTALRNPHIRPWGADWAADGIPALFGSALYIASLTVLAWSSSPLFRAAVIVTAATSFVHFAAALLSFPALATVLASRSSILLILVCLPLAMQRFWKTLSSGHVLDCITALTVLFRPSPLAMFAAALTRFGSAGAAIGAAISLLLLARHVPDWAADINTRIVIPLLGGARAVLLDEGRSILFLWPLFFAAVAAVVMIRCSADADGRRYAGLTLIAVLYAATARYAAITGDTETGAPYIEYRQAQVWARDNTPPGTGFMLMETIPQLSWRGLSERPVVSVYPVGTAYRSSQVAENYNERLRAFNRRHGIKIMRYNMREFPTWLWVVFAGEFGADFIVRPAAWPTLALPEAFRNDGFVIYALGDFRG